MKCLGTFAIERFSMRNRFSIYGTEAEFFVK